MAGCPGTTTTTTTLPSNIEAMKNPLGITPQNIAAGKELYGNRCQVCHGENGKGDGPEARFQSPKPTNFTSDDHFQTETDGEIFLTIFNGVPSRDMPSFKNRLTENQIWQIEAYIIQFRSNPANRKGFGRSTTSTSAGGTTTSS
jgi:mono/diheme cytochrome c family protein